MINGLSVSPSQKKAKWEREWENVSRFLPNFTDVFLDPIWHSVEISRPYRENGLRCDIPPTNANIGFLFRPQSD